MGGPRCGAAPMVERAPREGPVERKEVMAGLTMRPGVPHTTQSLFSGG
jgi:hypothetical protein